VFVCTVPQRPHELKLPSELLYASCACADRAQLADIRSRFKMATQGHVRRQSACEARPPNCLVEEVVVDCHRGPMASIGNVDLVCPTSRMDVLVHGHLTRDRWHGFRNATVLPAHSGVQMTEDRRTDQGSSDNRATPPSVFNIVLGLSGKLSWKF